MKRVAVAVLLVLLAGCAPAPTPRRAQATYLPGVMQPVRKLGMAGCPQHGASVDAFGLAWCYSWTPDPGPLPGVETVAMLWDATQVHAPLGGSGAWVLLFNEPNEPSQANLTPAAAAVPGAVALSRIKAAGKRAVCPAPSQRDIHWLPRWRAALRALGVTDFCAALAVHCYGDAAYCEGLVRQFEAWAVDWAVDGQPLEVWVTETGQPDRTEAQAFAVWLQGRPLVTRYAPFVSYYDCADGRWWNCAQDGDPSLLTADGELTWRGQWYAQPARPEEY